MEALLYFALWAGFVFLMMHAGRGRHVTSQDKAQKDALGRTSDLTEGRARNASRMPSATAGAPSLRWVPPDKDTDPVCNKLIATDQAKSSVYAGNVYYFCSRECREVFEAAPELYVGGSNQPKLVHSHV